MRTITILAASAAARPCVPALAQVRAGGTTRLRVETIDGQARAGFTESDTLLNLRTTLAAQYEEGPVRVVGELWDNLVTQFRPFTARFRLPDSVVHSSRQKGEIACLRVEPR